MKTQHNTMVVNIADLTEHPRNREFYGDITVDGPFLDSIRVAGILQPPIVTPLDSTYWPIRRDDDMSRVEAYRIIAGHRRIKALQELGETQVEVIVKDYADDDEEIYDFIASNATRTKDTRILILEVLQLLKSYQTLCQRSGDADASEKNDDSRIRGFDGIEQFEGLTLQDVALKIGASEKFVNAVRGIFMDDYREQYIKDIEATGRTFSKGGLKQFIGQWDKIRKGVLAGEGSMWQAYDAITSEKRSVVSKAAKKAGKEKPAKEKTPKVKLLDEAAETTVDDFLEPDNIRSYYYELEPRKLDPEYEDLIVDFARKYCSYVLEHWAR